MSVAEALTRAKGGEWHGTYDLIPTPGHSAKDRGLSIRDTDHGDDVVLHCFNDEAFDWRAAKDEWRAQGFLPAWDGQRLAAAKTASPAATYVYCGRDGVPRFRMVRKKGKQFYTERWTGTDWKPGMGNAVPTLYRLPELLAAPQHPVFIVEGEKDADNLALLGFTVTTNPNGAGKWRAEYAELLVGRECVILPDNDDAGRSHALDVKAKLCAAGIASVIVQLPGLPAKGDVSDWIEAGGNRGQIVTMTETAWAEFPGLDAEPEDAPAAMAAEEISPLQVEWFRDIRTNLCGLWLVKNLLPAVGLALIYGHPGCGKSFWALDIALHVALGWKWNGRKVKRGLVIYVGAEGTTGLRNRIAAFRQHYEIPATEAVPFVLIPTPIDLQAPDADTAALTDTIRKAAKKSGQQPVLIIIDTLSKTFGGGKENTDDMATYVANCQKISSTFQACVIPIHHRPKDAESEEPRGHGSLKGGVDTVILIEAGKPRRVRVTKQKDGETGDDTAFNLTSVSLGHDEDDEPVTSCVVEIADPVRSVVVKGQKLTDKQIIVLRALKGAINEEGSRPPDNLPAAMSRPDIIIKGVSVKSWRASAIAAMIGPDCKPDSASRMFRLNCEKLQAKEIVQVWHEFAWVK